MPEKQWIVHLGGTCRVEVEKITLRGRVIGFRIVLLAEIEGDLHCVTRYDTAHGFAHRDVLGFGGKQLDKEVMPIDGDYNVAFGIAYRDIIENHEKYLRFYKTR